MKQKNIIKFSNWKTASRRFNLKKSHVSMDGEKEKITVKPLK